MRRERLPGLREGGLDLERAPQQPLAFRGISSEHSRKLQEHDPFGGQHPGGIGGQGQGSIDLTTNPADRHQAAEADGMELEAAPQIAEYGEVPRGISVIAGDRLLGEGEARSRRAARVAVSRSSAAKRHRASASRPRGEPGRVSDRADVRGPARRTAAMAHVARMLMCASLSSGSNPRADRLSLLDYV